MMHIDTLLAYKPQPPRGYIPTIYGTTALYTHSLQYKYHPIGHLYRCYHHTGQTGSKQSYHVGYHQLVHTFLEKCKIEAILTTCYIVCSWRTFHPFISNHQSCTAPAIFGCPVWGSLLVSSCAVLQVEWILGIENILLELSKTLLILAQGVSIVGLNALDESFLNHLMSMLNEFGAHEDLAQDKCIFNDIYHLRSFSNISTPP